MNDNMYSTCRGNGACFEEKFMKKSYYIIKVNFGRSPKSLES